MSKKYFKDLMDDSTMVSSQSVMEGEILFDVVFMLIAYIFAIILIFKYLVFNEFAKIFLVGLLSKTMLSKIFKSSKEYVLMFKTNLKILREERAKKKNEK